jgi:hypothetical protein
MNLSYPFLLVITLECFSIIYVIVHSVLIVNELGYIMSQLDQLHPPQWNSEGDCPCWRLLLEREKNKMAKENTRWVSNVVPRKKLSVRTH